MNSLRLFTNAIRANTSTINCVTKQRNSEHMRYFKCATASFSPVAGAFTRNATTVCHNTNRSTSCGDSNRARNPQSYQWILSPYMQDVSGSVMYCSKQPYCRFGTKTYPDLAIKSDSKSAAVGDADIDLFAESSKLGLFARFKLMYKMYWYVLIPVHVVTSAGWLCGFYYLSQSGVDVPAMLQYLHLSETIIEKVQGSSLGHWAVAYLCYKVATPIRYAVTLGGTTVSIKYLGQQGYIKPMPTKAQFVQMYEDKKARRAVEKANKENVEKLSKKQK